MLNSIKIKDDFISSSKVNDDIKIDFANKNDLFSINSIKFNIYKKTDLEIQFDSKSESKLDLFFHIHKNASLKIIEKREGKYAKVQYKFYVDEDASVESYKMYNASDCNELCLVNLNGKNAKFKSDYKVITTEEEKYSFLINHNASKTESDLSFSAVNISDGKITTNMTSLVPTDKEDCLVNQSGRIINFNDKSCVLKPNLIIESDSCIANHSAAIGNFSDEEIFYMMSRGIDEKNTINLLTKGFLLNNLESQIDFQKHVKKVVSSYWR